MLQPVTAPLLAEETRRAILEHLLANRELVIDLSAVEACDTAGLQLLCSAAASAAQAGKPFRLDNIPGAVLERWNGLGLPASFLTTAKA